MGEVILLMYRDNDLFREWVPEIVKILQSSGQTVEIQKFQIPKETLNPQKEIREWLENNTDKLKGRKVLADITCHYALSRCGSGLGKLTVKYSDGLERALDRATAKTLLPEQAGIVGEDCYRILDTASEKGLTIIIKRLLERINPGKVYILTKSLLDHEPFWSVQDDITELQAAHEVRKMMVAGGISSIEIVEGTELPEEADNVDNWVVHDRHVHGICLKNAISFELPLGDFLRTAKQLLPDFFKEDLKVVLEKEFKAVLD